MDLVITTDLATMADLVETVAGGVAADVPIIAEADIPVTAEAEILATAQDIRRHHQGIMVVVATKDTISAILLQVIAVMDPIPPPQGVEEVFIHAMTIADP